MMDRSFSSFIRSIGFRRAHVRLWRGAPNIAESDPVGLSRDLLTTRGEASGVAIADRLLLAIEGLDEPGLAEYFHALRDAFETNLDAVIATAERAKSGDTEAMAILQDKAEPPRQELFRRLNSAPGGTARLVEIRRRLLRHLRADKSLAPIDADLRHLFRSWFNRGFLVLERIDWNTSAAILEKIIAYEAVHAIDTWDALRERLAPIDRRCFAFFHPAMPDEPLIFVEVALTRGLATSIQTVLQSPREVLEAETADTAIFYSISNCQAGLAGISFGAFLIKQVAADLKTELSNLETFATLSPVPGLANWLSELGIATEPLIADSNRLQAAAATYLAEAKGKGGRPRDPVAKFHLANGAALHQINVQADISPKGLGQSHGVMVNYHYDLDLVEARHEAFAEKGELALSKSVQAELAHPRPWAHTTETKGASNAVKPNLQVSAGILPVRSVP